MGRPATGRTTVLRRLPSDCDYKRAIWLYCDVLPVLEKWAHEAACHAPSEPRWANIIRLLDEVGVESTSPSASLPYSQRSVTDLDV